MHVDRYGSTCILLHADIQLRQYHLLRMLSFFPLSNFSFFAKNKVFIEVWINFRDFNFKFYSISQPVSLYASTKVFFIIAL